ncbi:MAG: nitrilase-related carbon-nitrogen hydrolase, partial [Caldisericaceae bacterium]
MKYNFALGQINPILGNLRENLNKHLSFIDAAAKENADLIVFPELSLSGYYLKDLAMEVALSINDKLLAPLKEKSKALDIVF